MESLLDGVAVNTTYRYRAGRVLDLVRKLTGRRPDRVLEDVAGDLFYIFYLPLPRVRRDYEPSNERDLARLALVAETLSSPRTWKIKAMTVADAQISMVAAGLYISILARQRGGGESLRPLSSPSSGKGGRRSGKVERALNELSNAMKNVSALKSIVARVGAGTSSSLMFEDSLDIVMELSRRTDVSEIERILSRIEVSRVSSKRTTRYTRGWVGGLELGGDIERLHISQLALPEEVFYAQLANSRMLLYHKELSAEEGPLYVLLDKSGSMSGEKINWARAVALALLIKARSAGRDYYVRFFDSIVYELKTVTRRVRPRDLMELIKYLATVKATGGTNITNAIAKAVEDIESGPSRGPSDIVLITDGEDKLSTYILRGLLQSPRDIRLHTVMIKGDNPTLMNVSDTYMSVARLGEEEALKLIVNIYRAKG
ncbi:MAG: VWA domain-containing protein [Desulfurococcales archaeon]|nr:VWA domain-containing protein [Desulfurococcales archaeon]